jgi:zinc finger SWIM domain-containing protein 3
MVLVPFTGIDNHNRCITFACGLISHEDMDSYKWLLSMFKQTFVNEPKVVVTDQDPSVRQIINDAFPRSRHRFCMWHIMQKLSTKVLFLLLFNIQFN